MTISPDDLKVFGKFDNMEVAIGRVVPALDLLQSLLCTTDIELGTDDLAGLSFLLHMCSETLEESTKSLAAQPET